MKHIKADEVQNFLEEKSSNVLILNVLPEAAFEQEHIPGSINIPYDQQDFLNQVTKQATNSTPIIVYCASLTCPTSKNAAQFLVENGFTQVMEFDGGMEEWRNSGKNIATGKL